MVAHRHQRQEEIFMSSVELRAVPSIYTLADRIQNIQSVVAKTVVPKDFKIYDVPDGMPLKVFNDKYAKRRHVLPDGTESVSYQSWAERITEVVMGNFAVDEQMAWTQDELRDSLLLGLGGHMPFAGRHLQHGDLDQPNKHMELFTNCSSCPFTFMLFKLLLDGSGVGSDYSSATRRVNWDNMPDVRLVLSQIHPDYPGNYNEFQGSFETLEEARAKYPSESERVRWFDVEDSREGWVKVIETLETAAYQEKHKDKLFIFNFTPVRAAGSPIRGQQNRPASGPLPFMRAVAKVLSIRGAGMAPWKQALYIDHYLAACVALGGVRRAARMATKFWKDNDIFEYIEIKRDGSLWTSNNSILVDQEFWANIHDPRQHAYRVFHAACGAGYYDRTGEPGFINYDKLTRNDEGRELITGENYLNQHYGKLDLHPKTIEMCSKILEVIKKLPYSYIVNPCGEIVLSLTGAYCTIADGNAAYATKEQLIRACELSAHALIRANLMNSMFSSEVKRTNRIGVGLIGIFEFAWREFQCNFFDIISIYELVVEHGPELVYNVGPRGSVGHHTPKLTEQQMRAVNFWKYIDQLRQRTELAAIDMSKRLGVAIPHTFTTIKPAGTTSKVLNCTEGANLPAYAHYLRWVQYENETAPGVTNPALTEAFLAGYPVEDVSHKYPGKSVVGFPTKQPIVDLIGPENVVTADQVSVEQHYQWLELLEAFWLGYNEDGSSHNNQISYTLKFRMSEMSYDEFRAKIAHHQSRIRCCAFMDQEEIAEMKEKYGYVPEQPISHEEYLKLTSHIHKLKEEAYDNDALACAGGICPIEVNL